MKTSPCSRFLAVCTVVFGSLGSGCSASAPALRRSPPAALADPDQIRFWLQTSAPEALLGLLRHLATDLETLGSCQGDDPPSDKIRVAGPCRDTRGELWLGKARIDAHIDGFDARFNEVANRNFVIDGSIAVDFTEPAQFELDAMMTRTSDTGPIEYAFDYAATERADGAWSATGTLAASGHGVVEITIVDMQPPGPHCPNEPLLGQVDLRTRDHHAIVQFDGLEDCDSPGTARLRLDDIDRGEFTMDWSEPSSCRIEPDAPMGRGLWLVLLIALGRRRRSTKD